METRRRESLRAPVPREVPVPHSEVGLRHRGDLEVRSETAGGGGGQVGVESVRFGPPIPPGSLVPDEWVVLVCG